MDILLTGIFIRVFCLNEPSVTFQLQLPWKRLSSTMCQSWKSSVYVVLNTAFRGNSPMEGAFFIRAHWYRLLCCKASVTPA